MRQEHRTTWWLWTCDGPGCGLTATTHRDLEGADAVPEGWLTQKPPAPWKGAALAFHATECRDRFVASFVADLKLLGDGS